MPKPFPSKDDPQVSLRNLILALPLCLPGPAGAASGTLYCPAQPTSIAVMGDSLADGVWGALERGWTGCKAVALHRVTAVSDGLTVHGAEAWTSRLADSLGPGGRAELVIIQLGANDIRPLRTGTGRAVFGTDEWKAAYGNRAAELLRGVADHAEAAIWLGLPVVGDTRLEEPYLEVSSVQSAAAAGTTVPPTRFVDTHGPTEFGTGGFVQSAEVDGAMTQLRAPDLIHFTAKGYDLVLAIFSADLERRLRARDAKATLDGLALQ